MLNQKIKGIQDFTENEIQSTKNMMNLSIEDSGNLIAENIDESNKERIQFIKNSLESFRPELKEFHEVSETLKKSVEQVIGDMECLTNESTKVKERIEKLEGNVAPTAPTFKVLYKL